MSGFVYFIAREGADMVKIGWSKEHPSRRMAQLQTGCPEPLDLLAFFPGSLRDEARLHRTFAPLQYRGEWFFNLHKLRDFIAYLTNYAERVIEPAVSRQDFEDAVWDVLLSGFEYPDRENLQGYRESADAREWDHLFPAELLQ